MHWTSAAEHTLNPSKWWCLDRGCFRALVGELWGHNSALVHNCLNYDSVFHPPHLYFIPCLLLRVSWNNFSCPPVFQFDFPRLAWSRQGSKSLLKMSISWKLHTWWWSQFSYEQWYNTDSIPWPQESLKTMKSSLQMDHLLLSPWYWDEGSCVLRKHSTFVIYLNFVQGPGLNFQIVFKAVL